MLAFADAFWLMGVLFLVDHPADVSDQESRGRHAGPGGGGMMDRVWNQSNQADKVTTSQNAVETIPGRAASSGFARAKLVVAARRAAVPWRARPMPSTCITATSVSSDDAKVDGHITAIAPKIAGNVIEVAVDRQPAGEGRAGAGAHRPARLPGQGGYGQGRAAAGREPVARGPSGGAVDRRDHPIRQYAPPPRSWPTPRPSWSARASAYEQASRSDLAYAEANMRVQAGQQRPRPGRPGAHEAAGG